MYTIDVHRTQILLERRQYEALKAMARRSACGLSELVRRAIDKLLHAENPAEGGTRLKDICAIARDRGGISERDHDKIVYRKDW